MFEVAMNKKRYIPCELDVISFDVQDVITTSGFLGERDDLGELLGGDTEMME